MSSNADSFLSIIKSFQKMDRLYRRYLDEELGNRIGVYARYIHALARYPGESQDFFADYHSVDKSRVARVCRELENSGYITRQANEHNRRRSSLYLTEKGMQLYARIQEAAAKWGSLIAGDLDEKDLAIFNEVMDHMIEKGIGK